jgi:hypothetical protein
MVGRTQDPAIPRLVNTLMNTMIQFRRQTTGVQFSKQESDQYLAMFPNVGNEEEVNLALVDGLLDSMYDARASYWVSKLGEDGARLVGALEDRPFAESAEGASTPPASRARDMIDVVRERMAPGSTVK